MTTNAPVPAAKTESRPTTTRPRLWNVVLLDDDDHTYEYVIEMMQVVFGFPPERGFQVAEHVDRDGRAVLVTVHRELAELKREQVLAFGRDPRMSSSAGSMSAILEPADLGDDD